MAADGSVRHPPRTNLAWEEPSGCPEDGQDVSLYADGELGDAERVAMEAHLVKCPACRQAADYELKLRRTLREKVRQGTPVAPRGLERRLHATLERSPGPAPALLSIRRWVRPMPVAAAGATALGLTAFLYFGSPTENIVRDLVVRHTRRLPLEFHSSDPRALQDWLAGKIDFHVHLPPRTGPGLSLLGARLSEVRDHTAVYVVYGNPKHPAERVSMFVYDDPSRRPPAPGIPRRIEDREVYTANAAGYNVAVWRDHEIVYSLVSDGDDNVLDLVREVNAPGP